MDALKSFSKNQSAQILGQSDTLDQNKLEIEKLKVYIERSDQVILDQCDELKQQKLRIRAFDRSKTFIQNVESLAPSTGPLTSDLAETENDPAAGSGD